MARTTRCEQNYTSKAQKLCFFLNENKLFNRALPTLTNLLKNRFSIIDYELCDTKREEWRRFDSRLIKFYEWRSSWKCQKIQKKKVMFIRRSLIHFYDFSLCIHFAQHFLKHQHTAVLHVDIKKRKEKAQDTLNSFIYFRHVGVFFIIFFFASCIRTQKQYKKLLKMSEGKFIKNVSCFFAVFPTGSNIEI